jgi:hypothetical protein
VTERDTLAWVHDVAETVLAIGVLVAIAAYALRRGPLEAFGRNAGLADGSSGSWWGA